MFGVRLVMLYLFLGVPAYAQFEDLGYIGPETTLGLGNGRSNETTKYYNSTGDYLGESRTFRDNGLVPLPHIPNGRLDLIPSTPYQGHTGGNPRRAR